jgi:hypothetical protein
MLPSWRSDILWGLHEAWRAKLFAAESRFKQDPGADSKAEYLRILRIFKDLVMYNMLPCEPAQSLVDSCN